MVLGKRNAPREGKEFVTLADACRRVAQQTYEQAMRQTAGALRRQEDEYAERMATLTRDAFAKGAQCSRRQQLHEESPPSSEETHTVTMSDAETNGAIAQTDEVDARSPAPVETEGPSESTMSGQRPVRASTLAMPPPKRPPHKKRSTRKTPIRNHAQHNEERAKEIVEQQASNESVEEVELETTMETKNNRTPMIETKANDPYEFVIDEDATPLLKRSTATPRRLMRVSPTKTAQTKQKTSVKKRPAARQESEAPAEKRRHGEAEERKKAILAERSEKIHREREERQAEAHMRKAVLDAMSPALRNQLLSPARVRPMARLPTPIRPRFFGMSPMPTRTPVAPNVGVTPPQVRLPMSRPCLPVPTVEPNEKHIAQQTQSTVSMAPSTEKDDYVVEILDSPEATVSKASSTSSEIPTTVNGTPEERLDATSRDDSAGVMTGRKKRPTLRKTALPPTLGEPQVVEAEKSKKKSQRKSSKKKTVLKSDSEPGDSYNMTPLRPIIPASDTNYNIDDLRSGDETDDEDEPRKPIPTWAQGEALSHALIRQKNVFDERRQIEVFGLARPMQLDKIFRGYRVRGTRSYTKRTSTAFWDAPPYTLEEVRARFNDE